MSKHISYAAVILALLCLLSACSAAPQLQDLQLVTPPTAEKLPTAQPNTAHTQEPSQTQEPEASVSPLSPTTGLAAASLREILAVTFDPLAEQDWAGIAQADVVYEFFPKGEESTLAIALYHDEIPSGEVSPLGAIYGYAVPYLEAWQPQSLYAFGHDATQQEDKRAITRLQALGIELCDGAAQSSDSFRYDAATEQCMATLPSLHPTQTAANALDFSMDAQPFDRMAYTITMGDWVYRYDETTGLYSRYVKGSDAKDANGQALHMENVIFLRTLFTSGTTEGQYDTEVSLGGEADIFSQGSCLYSRWKYEESTGRISLLNEEGQAAVLAPGKTWIHIIPEESGVDFE